MRGKKEHHSFYPHTVLIFKYEGKRMTSEQTYDHDKQLQLSEPKIQSRI